MANAVAEVAPLQDPSVQASAHQAPADEVPVPPQYQQARVNDFRGVGFAPKGYRDQAVKSKGSKRKLDEYQEEVQDLQSASEVPRSSTLNCCCSGVDTFCLCAQVNKHEAEMQDDDKPAVVSFKKLKTTKSDVSGVGKVFTLFCVHHRHPRSHC